MDRLGKIEALFKRANQAPVPIFHVGDRVLVDIAMRETLPLSPLSFVAGISAAAAAVSLFFAIQGWLSISSTVANYFDPAVLDLLL